jgi:hypothetical protein
LLNAAHPGINYGMTTSQIITAVQNAYAGGNFQALKNQLDHRNNRGADLRDTTSPPHRPD